MTKRNDISVPQGYFEDLEKKLQRIPSQAQPRVSTVQRFAPYLAYAASLALLLGLGNLIFRYAAAPSEEDYSWEYVHYLSQSLDPDGLIEYSDSQELSEDEIVNYLLASNYSLEQLNAVNDEEDY